MPGGRGRGARSGERPAVLDATDRAVLLEGGERVAEALVVDAELCAKRAPGERRGGVAERLEDVAGEGGSGRRRVAVRVPHLEVGTARGLDEMEREGLRGGRGAVLEREEEPVAGPHEVGGGVGPGVDVGAAAEGKSTA